MSRIDQLRAEFGEFIPNTLQNGVLYISEKYKTASHLCCCGCGNKVVTPLKPAGWRLIKHQDSVSLYPSIGSWSLPCKSHYWIWGNRIVWDRKWTPAEIAAVRGSDQRAREHYYDDAARREERAGLWQYVRRFFRR